MINIGCSSFLRWWSTSPTGLKGQRYNRWHYYHLDNASAGYFVANVVEHSLPLGQTLDERIWYPRRPKEDFLLGTIRSRSPRKKSNKP